MSEANDVSGLLDKPFGQRMAGYLRLSGPGYLQSAMTLGGGTIASCVLLGSMAGYTMLWLQPVAILLGVCVLGAVAKQTCHAQEKPYDAFWNRLHPAMALCWGISAFVATILWHIPQYALTANGAIVLGEAAGLSFDNTAGRALIGLAALASAVYIVSLYHSGASGLRLYERAVKILVWMIVLAFAVAAVSSGIRWGALIEGFTGIAFIRMVAEHGGVPPQLLPPLVGGLAASVGINMVFLYPYSILRKNWGPDHKELAYFDLASGMVLPFLISTGFMIVAVANTIGPDGNALGAGVKDIREILPVLSGALGDGGAHLVIGLGMFAVGFSTIITHMLASGFIGCELFGIKHEGWPRLLFSLCPAIGVIGVLITVPFWAAVTASVLAAPLMPVTVLGFLILLNMKSYMGDERPKGLGGLLLNLMLLVSIVALSVGAWFGLSAQWSELKKRWQPEAAAAASPSGAMKEQVAPAPVASFREFRFKHAAMGGEFEFIIHSDTLMGEELAAVCRKAFAAIDALEARVSNWRPDSITSEVMRQAGVAPVSVDEDLLAMLSFCRDIHAQTGGVFDPTVGPLLAAWGKYRETKTIPTEAEVKQALALVGLNQVEIDPAAGTVYLPIKGMGLDFGGIAKGRALDEARKVLKDNGIERALLSAATSTMLAMGPPPGAEGWTVDIGHPYNGRDVAVDTLSLRNEALSTSSSREQFIEIEGRRFSHIVDPRTGYPVEPMLSATVVGPTGMACDALSTAFYIMGEDATRQYCRDNQEYKAVLVFASGEQTAQAVRINFRDEEETT